MSGYWVMGRETKPKKPSRTMKMEITVDSTGLLMNKSNFIDQQFLFALVGN